MNYSFHFYCSQDPDIMHLVWEQDHRSKDTSGVCYSLGSRQMPFWMFNHVGSFKRKKKNIWVCLHRDVQAQFYLRPFVQKNGENYQLRISCLLVSQLGSISSSAALAGVLIFVLGQSFIDWPNQQKKLCKQQQAVSASHFCIQQLLITRPF